MSPIDPIYLDYQATTPLAPEALAAMGPWLKDNFWNPHSAHAGGRKAAAAVEAAREAVAALLPSGGRVIFTSGATEAINLAIKGSGLPVMASATEHAAVLDCVEYLGGELLPVDGEGLLLNPFVSSVAETPISSARPHGISTTLDANGSKSGMLVAVMLVNNEIGTIQPVAELASETHARGGLFLCDAVQGYGRIPIPEGPDMIAISAHKIYGPKGIGALWVRDGVELQPLIHGGGQEQGLRSGTLSPALCVGFGAAAKPTTSRLAASAASSSWISRSA